jgi:hypothetical protein
MSNLRQEYLPAAVAPSGFRAPKGFVGLTGNGSRSRGPLTTRRNPGPMAVRFLGHSSRARSCRPWL